MRVHECAPAGAPPRGAGPGVGKCANMGPHQRMTAVVGLSGWALAGWSAQLYTCLQHLSLRGGGELTSAILGAGFGGTGASRRRCMGGSSEARCPPPPPPPTDCVRISGFVGVASCGHLLFWTHCVARTTRGHRSCSPDGGPAMLQPRRRSRRARRRRRRLARHRPSASPPTPCWLAIWSDRRALLKRIPQLVRPSRECSRKGSFSPAHSSDFTMLTPFFTCACVDASKFAHSHCSGTFSFPSLFIGPFILLAVPGTPTAVAGGCKGMASAFNIPSVIGVYAKDFGGLKAVFTKAFMCCLCSVACSTFADSGPSS